ncbi:MAG: hypothetical protein JWR12_2403 [Mucilaginibacter sp.]|jgi:hypothetical protein|nr:hypothetical protein [Mucilaginibacter sp.]
MTTITIEVPENKKKRISNLIKSEGIHVVNTEVSKESEEDDDEVTHTVFFGENIKRVLKAFK